jgi:hypothetical protein
MKVMEVLMNKQDRFRLFVIPVVVATLLSFTTVASFADTGGSVAVDSASKVTLTAAQTDYTLPLSIDHADAFAGVELAVQCGEGVTITSVDYSKNISHAGPTEARGLVWFATFSGDNEFAGKLTATVHVNYEGSANTSIVIDHAAFHTIDGSAFRTENVPLRKTVEIVREGDAHTPPPLDPPDTGNPPGAGNPPSGAGNPPGGTQNSGAGADNPIVDNTGGAPQSNSNGSNNTTKAGETKAGNTKSSGSKNSSSGSSSKSGSSKSSSDTPSSTVVDRNTQPGKATAVSNSAPAAIPAVISNPLANGSAGGGAANTQNEQITSGDTEDTQQTSISSSKVPRAGGNANTMIPSDDIDALSTATLIMALACLAALAFLGFLFIKRKRDEQKKRDKEDVTKEVM